MRRSMNRELTRVVRADDGGRVIVVQSLRTCGAWLTRLLGCVALVMSLTRAHAQELGAVRSEIFTPDSYGSAQPQPESSSGGATSSRREDRNRGLRFNYNGEDEDDDTDDSASLLGLGAQLGFYATVGLGAWAFIGEPSNRGLDIDYEFDDQMFVDPRLYFLSHPYDESRRGYAQQTDDITLNPANRSSQTRFAFGTDFDDLSWYTLKGSLESSTTRWGLDAEWTLFHEQNSTGSSDQAHLGDINLTWRRVQSDRWLFRWGLGTVWYHDRTGTEAGLNATAKLDWFPREPWVVSAEYDLGKLGSATTQHISLGIGAAWRHAELFTAYDFRQFDDAEIAGPMFGIRFWY